MILHFSLYWVGLLILTLCNGSWIKTKDSPRLIAKTRKQIQKRQCQAPKLGNELRQTAPIFIEDYWVIGLDIPVQGPGVIEVWADLDGNGRFDGYQERVVFGLNNEFNVMPGAWELVAVEEFDRYTDKIMIHKAGPWADVTPWKYLQLALRLCPRRCFDKVKQDRLCKEYYYSLEMYTKNDPNIMLPIPHKAAAYGIPTEYFSHGEKFDPTIGIVSGILTSLILVGLFLAVGFYHYFHASHLYRDGLKGGVSSSSEETVLYLNKIKFPELDY